MLWRANFCLNNPLVDERNNDLMISYRRKVVPYRIYQGHTYSFDFEATEEGSVDIAWALLREHFSIGQPVKKQDWDFQLVELSAEE